ncbi:MAG: hypothetical protein KDC95_23005, partial [Planctomycetes bacterium]|nr:hypothetical protein [Planctomycetota bacterium]
ASAQTRGSWTPFGSGCPGTGRNAGVIVPASARGVMGNSNNYYPIGRADQRYQQVFVASEFSGPGLINAFSLRADELAGAAQSQTLEIRLGLTTYDPTTMTNDFAMNATGAQTTVLPATVVNLPATVANTDPNAFTSRIAFTTPFFYAATSNLLVEIRNTSTANQIHPYDAISGSSTNTTRMWASPVTATTGSLGRNYGLVMRFEGPSSNAVPQLAATGRPVINTTHSLDLSQAVATRPALFVLGFSNTTWGALTLPFDMSVLGARSCTLLVSIDLVFAVATDASGNASLPVSIPNITSLVNAQYYNQCMVLDAAANSLGLVMTNGGAATIGDV